ncbi:MAG: DHH family phosphoesterase [Vicinamibacterales bacterium]
MSEIDRLVHHLRNGRRFIVSSHQRSDGDAVGSAMAMVLALRALDKQAVAAFDAVAPSFLRAFPHVDDIRVMTESSETFDAAVIMECSELARTGIAGLDRSPVINIDHHPGNTGYGAINWIDESAAACGEMVFTLLDTMQAPITRDVATHIYLAVLTDTGSFHYSHISSRTFEVARRCVEAGADPQWIARTHYDNNTLARVRLFGAALNDIRLCADGRVAMLTMTRELLTGVGGTNEDVEGLINFPLTVKEIEAAALFKQVAGDEWRVSMRSKGAIDVGAIAKSLSGGGHKNAAGCTVHGELAALHLRFEHLLTTAVETSRGSTGP